MPKFNLGRLLEGTAYGVINEILAEFHSDDGFALPSRYEVVILPPQGTRGQPKGALNNVYSKVMEENTGEGTTRKVGAIFSNLYPYTYAIPGDILITIKSLEGVLPCAVNCSDV